MTKCILWLMALVSTIGLSSLPASACYVVGHANGETLCATTSDGATVENKTKKKSSKFSYTNSPVWVQTKGSIQVTTSKSATSSRVLVRHTSNANAVRQAHHWH